MGGTRGGADNQERRVLGASLCPSFHLCCSLSGMALPEPGVCFTWLGYGAGGCFG